MPVPGENDDADRQVVEHRIVALERSRLGVARPVRLERDLRDLALVGPFCRDQLGALRAAAMKKHHARMLGMDLVERVPDQLMVGDIGPTGEGDLRAGGNEDFVLGAAAGGDKLAAVDYGGSQRSVADE